MNSIERMNVRTLSEMVNESTGMDKLRHAAKLAETLRNAAVMPPIVSMYNKGIGASQDQGQGNTMAGKKITVKITRNIWGNRRGYVTGNRQGDELGSEEFVARNWAHNQLIANPGATMHPDSEYTMADIEAHRQGIGYVAGEPVIVAPDVPTLFAKKPALLRLEKYETEARKLLAEGFTTKAAQQRAKEYASRAFSEIKDAIQQVHLDGDRKNPGGEAVYFGIPSYPHEWKPKHVEMIRKDLPGAAMFIDDADRIAALAAEIKSTPISTKIADEKVAKEKAAQAIQSLNPELLAEFEKQAPAIAEDYRAYVAMIYVKMQAKFPKGVPAWVPATGPLSAYRQNVMLLQGVCDITTTTGPSGIEGAHDKVSTMTLNEATLKDRADKYGMAAAIEWFYKTNGKLGQLEQAKLHNDSDGDVHVSGIRGGKRVEIVQHRIINTSPLGKAFHQFPSRIYVDEKFMTELDYQKLWL